ncbi:MalM family protein [Vibrio sonorensis]|uniref:MalM family protein n=1 Tax=Vibrio sonorensis TaxID=1004316 RepID=UPI0008DB2B9E|nr:MalM family protein [Vibrio sonorensis]
MLLRRILLVCGCLALFGCQTSSVVEHIQVAENQKITSISDLKAVPMKLPSSATMEITPTNQVLASNNIHSPVGVFKLPANRGEFSVKVTSFIEDFAFVPKVTIFDASGQVIESYDSDQFTYVKPRFHLGNRLVMETDFFPPTNLEEVYLIVYADKNKLGGFTDVIHPARLEAEGRGNYLPEVEDISIPNGNSGKIEVSIDRVSVFNIGLGHASNEKSEYDVQIKEPQPETRSYYYAAIESAVQNDQLNKALSLLDEAKALNIEGVQQVFIKAVNNR